MITNVIPSLQHINWDLWESFSTGFLQSATYESRFNQEQHILYERERERGVGVNLFIYLKEKTVNLSADFCRKKVYGIFGWSAPYGFRLIVHIDSLSYSRILLFFRQLKMLIPTNFRPVLKAPLHKAALVLLSHLKLAIWLLIMAYNTIIQEQERIPLLPARQKARRIKKLKGKRRHKPFLFTSYSPSLMKSI